MENRGFLAAFIPPHKAVIAQTWLGGSATQPPHWGTKRVPFGWAQVEAQTPSARRFCMGCRSRFASVVFGSGPDLVSLQLPATYPA